MELPTEFKRVDGGWLCCAYNMQPVFGETPSAAYLNWLAAFQYYWEIGDAESV